MSVSEPVWTETKTPGAPAAVTPLPRAMSETTRRALAALGAAAGLGIAGDALLRPVPWGLNLFLWTLLFAAAAVLLGRRVGAARVAAWAPLVVGIGALAAWRDSPVLKALDIAALLVVLALAVLHAQGVDVRRGGVAAYVAGLLGGAIEAMVGTGVLALADVRWDEVPRRGWTRTAAAALRGAVIAAPLLFVFTALLVSADARFERLLSHTFAIDGEKVFEHLMLAGLFAWITGGVLRPMVLGGRSMLWRAMDPVPPVRLGVVETSTVLGSLNLLFLAFVLVQVPYLFGGAALPEGPGTLGYAEYARRGFFELVTVAALVLPLLLLLHWGARRDTPRAETLFRALAGTMVGLLFVIMASALHRMRLYQATYGLTELRLYTTAFMLWLAVVFAWFLATVLPGQRERFSFGAVTAALGMVAALHAVNPDGLIVRVNASRTGPVRFDAAYAAGLSGDAVPRLLSALADLSAQERCGAAQTLLRRWDPAEREDWRAWSWGRSRARSAVSAHAAELRRACDGVTDRRSSSPPGGSFRIELGPGA